MGGYGEGEMLDVIILVIAIPGESLHIDVVGHEDVLVVTMVHGNGNGGVVEKEVVSLP